ncbi:MAG: AAA family ATPase [Bacteroidaceae bacterium]|nr:AAA family ATPase [Bacteroidaceae bacterium]MDE6158553.1 AAA family ATPase [Bacteroidaceae bacterium]
MRKEDIESLILAEFSHVPTSRQRETVSLWADFLFSPDREEAFLLRGYAGTGKTSLVSALVRVLTRLNLRTLLLAPTGRAAKVFSLYAGLPAYTIHRKIYRQKVFNPEMNNFVQTPNLMRDTLFIVDEASMIANSGNSGGYFGSGRLLDDLVRHVYAGENCRLLLIGDRAQLPPVGEEQSPALSVSWLRGYGLHVRQMELTQVVRQADESGILWNATRLRNLIDGQAFSAFPKMRVTGFPDITILPGNELIESLEQSYHRCGTDQTIVVTRSNKRANIYNNGIRARILDMDAELGSGDQIIVAKNNYFWTEKLAEENKDAASQMPFIANGDVAVVRRVHNERGFYGFRFVDATLRFPDYNHQEMELTLLLDTLQAEAPALTREQQERLFHAVCEDYPEISVRRELMNRVKQDIYYNALQVKYAYAITCHKAQGGQWQHVYIDQGYLTEDMLSPDYFRWLYTALTRATEHVYLVNWPENQTERPAEE